MIRKVLIANRGEIAVRIIRTLRELGVGSVAVYSDTDRFAGHVRMAQEAVHIGPNTPNQSYLSIERILDAAKKSGADAIHPGYGFLSENEDFAEACEQAGITFIGPPAQAMAQMGIKPAARARMIAAGVPVVPGGNAQTAEEAKMTAAQIGYPVMLKAASGGGGKGMRLIHQEADIAHAFERAQSEALRSFGDSTVYLEKAIVNPRHVEIQILGDRHGNMVHLFERDCSIQRRHQKVIEESPCPVADEKLVHTMGEVAIRGAKSVGYFSAGTFEFLLDESGQFYFLEMNTRLQVEHPITEWITGVDLVAEMVRIANGEPLRFTQRDIVRRGAAIECRIYAEDPENGFLPCPGTITSLEAPSGPWVRDDSGYCTGDTVPSEYDPLIAKLSTWGATRHQAIARMRRALREYFISGIRTNIAFHERVMEHPDFIRGHYNTGFIQQHAEDLLKPSFSTHLNMEELAAAIATVAHRQEHRRTNVSHDNTMDPWVLEHRARLER